MSRAKIRNNFLVTIAIVLTILLSSVILSFFVAPSKVSALAAPNSAIKVLDGAELYNSDKNSFNADVVEDMLKKLFKGMAPIDYLKEHPFDPNPDIDATTYMVDATTINAQVGSNHGLVVKLGGFTWMIVSMTVTDSVTYGGKEDVVLTLYLADSYTNMVWNDTTSTAKGSNMYSSSDIRRNLLESSTMAQFSSGDFASNYLVQPKNIEYQQIESPRNNPVCPYDYPNESLSLHHGTTPYTPHFNRGEYSLTDSYNGIYYNEWGNDYIWLPSITEVGGKFGSNDSSIEMYQYWNLSNEQRESVGTYNTSWLRSGPHGSYSGAFIFSGIDTGTGVPYHFINSPVKNSRGVRPAIHLNLSEVLKNTSNLNEPEDLITTYNEKEQTIKDIATATKADWYDSSVYEATDNKITITYPDNATGIKNADEYWIKISINQSWLNAVNAQVDSEGATNGWSADYISIIKSIRQPKFAGTPNTTDSDHMETETERWIKVKINQAKIDLSKLVWSASELEYNALRQSVTIVSGLPSFVTQDDIMYSGNDHLDANVDGTFYTATISKITISDDNYATPTAAELAAVKHQWRITPKKVAEKWTTRNETDGQWTIDLPVLELEKNLESAVEYKYYRNSALNDELTLAEIFAEYSLGKRQTYYVKATFKASGGSFNATNCVFKKSDGTTATQVTDVFQTGTSKNLVTVDIKTAKHTYNGGDQKAEFTVSGGGLTETDLVVTYTTEDGSPLAGLPTNVGKYKAIVSLRSELTDFIIEGDTEFDFEIESLVIDKPREAQTQIFRAEGFTLDSVANLPSDWTKYFDVKVFDSANNELTQGADGWNFVNVGTYRIQLAFKNGMNTDCGGAQDNVLWSDNDKAALEIVLNINKLVLKINGWQQAKEGVVPTLNAENKAEVEKYFDYIFNEVKNGQIIGNNLELNAKLKSGTEYQIGLKVKSQFKGNVVLEYNGANIDETEPFKFKTKSGFSDFFEGLFGEDSNVSTPFWILLAVILCLLLLIIILIIVLVSNNRNRAKSAKTASIERNYYEENYISTGSSENTNSSYVNGDLMKNSDWTFIVREKDVVNVKAIDNANDRVFFYAFKEGDAKKVKKLHDKISEMTKEEKEQAEKQAKSSANKNAEQNTDGKKAGDSAEQSQTDNAEKLDKNKE